MENIAINIIDTNGKKHIVEFPIDPKSNLMEVVKEAGFSMGTCGGMALCASCHCYINHNKELNRKLIEEVNMLDQLHNVDFNSSRLICQIPLQKELNGIILRIAKN